MANDSKVRTQLVSTLEQLEPRVLLDSAGVWMELGPRGASGGGVSYDLVQSGPSAIAIGRNGYPVIAWESYSQTGTPDTCIYVAHFNGITWEPLGPNAMTGVGATGGIAEGADPQIAIDPHTGYVYVAYYTTSGALQDTQIYLQYFDGTQWQGLGNSGTGGGLSNDAVASTDPSLAIGSDGLPVVAYRGYDERSNDWDIIVKKWNGTAWQELTNNSPFPSVTDGTVTYYGGGVSDDVFNSYSPSLAIGADNAPVVTWVSKAFAQPAQIYARRWNGSAWQTLGNSASAPGGAPVGGISNTVNDSSEPTLIAAADPSDPGKVNLIVAWLEGLNLYMRQYDPQTSTWEEFSSGSASGTGVLGGVWPATTDLIAGVDGMPVLAYSATMPSTGRIGAYVLAAEREADGSITWNQVRNAPADIDGVNPVAHHALAPRIAQTPDGHTVICYTDRRDTSIADQYDDQTWPSDDPVFHYPYYDAYHLPFASPEGEELPVVDSELYVEVWDGATWQPYGDGAADPGGVEVSVGDQPYSYNSPPQMAVDGTGAGLMAYLHRVFDTPDRVTGHLEPRILRYDDHARAWEHYAGGVTLAADGVADAALDASSLLAQYATQDSENWRGDMLLISSDQEIISGLNSVPVVAYVDAVNTDDADPAVAGRATITVWYLDDNGTPSDLSDDAWQRVGTGTSGPAAYAYVAQGTVADGYTLDQVELIGWSQGRIALFWREVDPAGTVNGLSDITFDMANGVADPPVGVSGGSEIHGQYYDPNAEVWVPLGESLAGTSITGTHTYGPGSANYYLDFSPSAAIDQNGQLGLAFTSGMMLPWTLGDEIAPFMYSNIQLWLYDENAQAWEESASYGAPPPQNDGDPLVVSRDPSLAIGYGGEFLPVWTEEELAFQMFDPAVPQGDDPHRDRWIDFASTPLTLLTAAANDIGEVVLSGYWRVQSAQIMQGTEPEGEAIADGVLPSAYGNGSQFPIVSWTAAELEGAGYPVLVHAQWQSDGTNWTFVASRFDMDLGSVVNAVDATRQQPYSSFDRRMYYQNRVDVASRTEYIQGGASGIYPPVLHYVGNPAMTPNTERIYVSRYNPNLDEWENLLSREPDGTDLPSFSGEGISRAGAPGVMPDLVLHTVGEGTMLSSQPIVAWNSLYEDSIFVREWAHIGQTADLEIIENSGTANDDRIDFGRFYVDNDATQALTLVNNGAAALVIDSITCDRPGEFYLTDTLGNVLTLPLVIPSHGAVSVTVHADPTDIGPFTHTIRITSSDLAEPYRLLTLEGIRYSDARISIEERVGVVDDGVIPFGPVELGQVATRSFDIRNLGTDSLHVSRLAITGVNRNFVPWLTAASHAVGRTGSLPIRGASGSAERLAQSFEITSDAALHKVMLYLGRVGSPTDNVVVRIETDAAGVPSGTVVPGGVSSPLAAADVASAASDYQAYSLVFPAAPSLAAGERYWIVVQRDGARDSANYVAWAYDGNGGYASGQAAGANSGTWDAASHTAADMLFGVATTMASTTVAPGGTLRVNVDFICDAASLNGIVSTAWVFHDDYNLDGAGQLTANPLSMAFTANKPDFEAIETVSPILGTYPAVGRQAISWGSLTGVQYFPLDYPQLAIGQAATISVGGGVYARSRTEGRYVVWEQNAAIWMHDLQTGQLTDLTGALPGQERWVNIDGGRIVYASNVSGSWDIHMMDLATRQVTIIPEGAAGETDFFPDISGNLITWRSTPDRGGADPADIAGENPQRDKTVWAYTIPAAGLTSTPYRVATGPVTGPRIPAAGDGRVVWTEWARGAYQVRYFDTVLAQSGTVVDQFEPIGNLLSLSGNLVAWSSARLGSDSDIYCYYFQPRPGEQVTGPQAHGQVFQVTYAGADQAEPSTFGNVVVYTESTVAGDVVRYARLPGAGNLLVSEDTGTANDGILDFETVYTDFPKTASLTLTNDGTGDVTISGLTLSDARLTIVDAATGQPLPADYVLAVGDSLELLVTCDTGADMTVIDATLTIASDDWNDPTIEVRVIGTVAEPHTPELTTVATLNGTEDTPLTITYAQLMAASDAVDADGDPIQFRIEAVTTGTLNKAGQPVVAGVTLLGPGETVVWRPAANANGLLGAFTVVAWDGYEASAAPVQVQVNVAPVNDAPTLTTIATLIGRPNQDTVISYAALLAASDAADVDGDTVFFRIEAVTAGTLSKNGAAVTPGTTTLGPGESVVWHSTSPGGPVNAFTVRAWDGALASTPAVTVPVLLNNAPLLTRVNPLTGAIEDTAFTITYNMLAAAANESDPNGDAISFRFESVLSGTLTKGGVAITPGVTLLGPGESVVWHPATDVSGQVDAFTVRAWDGDLASADAIVVPVQIVPVADDPVLTTFQPLTGATEDLPFAITYDMLVAASDAYEGDGHAIWFRVGAVVSGTLAKNGAPVAPGTLLGVGEQFVWTPPANGNGALEAFTLDLWDGAAASDAVVPVSVEVTPVNDVPQATAPPSASVVEEDGSWLLTLGASDVETALADLVFNVPATTTGGGTLVQQSQGTYLYTPAADFTGTDSFTFTVTDGGDPHDVGTPATSDTVTVLIQVGQTLALHVNQPVTFTDADGDVVTVTLKGRQGYGTLFFAHDGACDLSGLTLDAVNGRSYLKIDVRPNGGDGRTTIRNLVADAAIRGVAGRQVDFVGGTRGGEITLGGTSGVVTKLDLGSIANVDFTSARPVKLLRTLSWANADGYEIVAPWVSKLVTAGQFASDMRLTSTGASKTLAKAIIGGNLADSVWQITGNLGKLAVAGTVVDSTVRTTGSMYDLAMGAAVRSDFLAGIDAARERRAESQADFVNASAVIRSARIRGVGVTTRALDDSNFSAATVKSLKLLNGLFDNDGDAFGVFASSQGGAMKVTHTDRADASRNFAWSRGAGDLYTLEDFIIRVL